MGKVYKKVELVGTSEEGLEDAIDSALERAGETLRGLSWFEVKEIRGRLEDDGEREYQVTLEVGFELEEVEYEDDEEEEEQEDDDEK